MNALVEKQHEQVSYRSTFRLYHREELGSYLSGGIAALDPEGRVLEQIEDISNDFEWLERLTRRLNEGQAALGHLHDIVYDALADL